MANISLTPYSIRIRERMARKGKFLPITKFDGSSNLFEIFDRVVLSGTQQIPSSPNRSFSPRTKKSTSTYRDGWLEIGNSGYGSRFQDKSGAQVFKREREHTEFIPLYFQLSAKDSYSDVAILMLQSFDRSSLKTPLHQILKSHFDVHHDNYTIHVSKIFNREMARRALRRSPIQRVRCIRRLSPKDQADVVLNGRSYDEGEIELILKSAGGNPFGLRDAVLDVLSGSRRINEVMEFENIDFNQVKVEIEVQGRTRTLNLAAPDKLDTSFDISDDIEFDPVDGHPELESIRAYSTELASSFDL